jgi:hypothetical protein
MRHRALLLTLLAFFVVVALIWLKPQYLRQSLSKRPNPATVAAPSATISVHSSIRQIDASRLSLDEIRTEVKRREALDRTWEWKVPIKFVGKVVDENDQPVSRAEIKFQWTNLSTKGTGNAEATSDDRGFFSVDGIEGKRLVIRVSKPGYYASDPRNRWSFEYANPFEEIFYIPKPEHPVIFYLRRQAPSADVASRSIEVMLAGDGTKTEVQVETGQIGNGGELLLQAWKPWPPRPMSPPYDWKVKLIIESGGFVDAPDQFAFAAPEIGYAPEYTIDMRANLASQWRVSVERTLYFVFGNPRKYGRLSLRTDGNSRYIFVDYVINREGGRNLEAQSLSK